MRPVTVARNYAEALFALGEQHGDTVRYADLMDGLRNAIRAEGRIGVVLESPRVPKPQKRAILEEALEGLAPAPLIRFLGAVIKRNRQAMLPQIADQYLLLVDEKFNRVHAQVTLAREPTAAMRETVRTRLAAVLGKEVIAHFRADPDILGGVIARVGDRIMDGSVRRRKAGLRRKLLGSL